MKTIIVIILSILSVFGYSQTSFYTQDFETSLDWTLNSGVSISNGNNYWVWSASGGNVRSGLSSLQIWRRSSGAWNVNYGNFSNQNRTAVKTFNFSTIPSGSTLNFKYWIISNGELLSGTYYDYFQVEVNGVVVQGPITGITSWTQKTIDLSSYIGQSSVVITLRWINDGSFSYQPAARIDDIEITYDLALPVELISFTGENYGNYNLVNWKTSSEINSSYFRLEKSKNGFDWESPFNLITSAGNSTQILDYVVKDYTDIDEITYYKLYQYDINGDYDDYGIISVNKVEYKKLVKVTLPNGQEVSEDTKGIVYKIFDDGSVQKVYQ